jgi:molecular chaperone DnaJ
MPEDLYELLGVPATATAAEITRAYRRLARSLHPDACPGDPSAADRFARMTAAYRVLADPQQRAAYDRQRMAGGTVGPRLQGRRVPVTVVDDAATGSPFSTWPFVESPFSTSGYFAPATGVRRQRPAAQPSPRPGRDTTGELTLAFADAITGVSVTV